MKRFMEQLAAFAILAACAGGSGPSSAGPDRALAHTMPSTNPLAYDVADTVSVLMDIAGTSVTIEGNSQAMLQLEYAASGGGLRTIVRFTALTGSFANSMGPTQTISASDMPGPATVVIGPRGDVTVTDRPAMTETAAQILGSEAAYLRLFTRLPGRVVAPGTEWTDTVDINDQTGEMATQTRSVVTSVLAGDTMLAGRRLHVIRSQAQATTRIAGSNSGFEIRQSLTGTSTAVTLWDAALGALVERTETTTMSGTMELPAMNMSGIPVTFANRQVMRIVR